MGYIRKLTPADRPAIRAHFARLHEDDVRLRFGHAASPAVITTHVDGLDGGEGILVGHLDSGRILGFLEILPFTEAPERTAELALTVERPWQEQGIGTELCRRGLIMACNRGIVRVVMICLTENIRMQRVAAKLEGRVLSRAGQVESEVLLPAPSPWSFAQESSIVAGGLVAELTEGWRRDIESAPAL